MPVVDSLYEKYFVMFTGSASLVSSSAVAVKPSGMKSVFDCSCTYLILSSEVSLAPEWVSYAYNCVA